MTDSLAGMVQRPWKDCIECGTRFFHDSHSGGFKKWVERKFCSLACKASKQSADVWRFMERPSDPSACWIWPGARRWGYGIVDRGATGAHRRAWERERGPIPDGLFVCHHCDNPPCVRPSHLFLGTNADNMKDCVSKGRHAAQKRAARLDALASEKEQQR